jgi:CAAX prenyl protease-like protein
MSDQDKPLLSGAAWVRVLPFLVYLLFIIIADLLARAGVPAQALRWLYPVKIVCVLVTLAACWRHYRELHRWDMGPKAVALAILLGVAVFALWITLSNGWMVIGTSTGFDPRNDGQIDWLLVALRIAGAALVVPVMEELFWRSFLIRWLDKGDFEQIAPSAVRLSSVAIGALLFGFEHNLWLAGIVAGLVYSALYMRTCSLWSAIIAHAVTNAILGMWIVRTGQWSFW